MHKDGSIVGASEKAEKEFERQYPAAFKHLLQFKDKLLKRNVEETNKRYEWYALQRFASDYYPEFEKPKIVWNRITNEVYFPFIPIGVCILDSMFFITGENLKNISLFLQSNISSKILIPQFCALLGKGYYAAGQYVEEIPIRLPENTKPYETLADYLLFLNAKEEWKENLKEMIEFLDRQIVDSLVYELYFKEKFHEDGLYPKPKGYLLEAVSKHLKHINYDRWAGLYWKERLKGKLSRKEKEELEKLTKKNMKTVGEVYEKLKKDKKVEKLIEKIKGHRWVKIVEGKQN